MIKHLLSLFYPAVCLHCKGDLIDPFKYLCKVCSTQLTLKDSSHVLFEEIGPAKDLFFHFEMQCKEKLKPDKLTDLIASFYVFKFAGLNYKMPNFVTSVPEKQRLPIHPCPIKLIAKSVSKMLKIPYKSLFKRKLDDRVYDQDAKLLSTLVYKETIAQSTLCICKKELKEIKELQSRGFMTLSYF